jgi:hypothetical protein
MEREKSKERGRLALSNKSGTEGFDVVHEPKDSAGGLQNKLRRGKEGQSRSRTRTRKKEKTE